MTPIRIINSVAPMRICDNGGWTDTWFAGHGQVFNIAVHPSAHVQVRVHRGASDRSRISIYAENYGHRYVIEKPHGRYDKHPLLEAALEFMSLPEDLSLEVAIYSEAPAGCSTGTSAAVSVALVGALDCLTPGRLSPHEVAMAAHQIETQLLGYECGVQDQLAAAYGGINFIQIHAFPQATVSPLEVAEATRWELENRLALIFAGRPHSSSDVHKQVIANLRAAGPRAAQLDALRAAAAQARDAVCAGDMAELGRAMAENTAVQAALHPALVSTGHRAIIDIAKRCGAAGWKVNGAGGEGGSVTLLGPDDPSITRAMVHEIERANPSFKSIPIYLSRRGLRRWDS